MARSFWKRRQDSISTAGGFVRATDNVSRPMAVLLSVVAILIVGALLFGVFWGTRLIFSNISDKPTTSSTGTPQKANTGSITATSSTSTSTPSSASTPAKPAAAPAVVATPAPKPAAAPTPTPAKPSISDTGPGIIDESIPNSF